MAAAFPLSSGWLVEEEVYNSISQIKSHSLPLHFFLLQREFMPKKTSLSHGSVFARGRPRKLGLQSHPSVLTVPMEEFRLTEVCVFKFYYVFIYLFCECVFWGLNLGHRAWQQAPLPTEPSHVTAVLGAQVGRSWWTKASQEPSLCII